MVKIDESFDGKSIAIKKGETIEIALPENPTTGYRWTINSYNKESLSLENEDYSSQGSGIGAGGSKKFVFKVFEVKESELKFSFGNAWEQNPEKTVTVYLK